MTYLLISLPFLIVAFVVAAARWRKYPRQGAIVGIVLAVVLVLTVIFDNLMIAYGNVAYGEHQNLGIYLGLVPIEDLFYPIFAGLIITALWPPLARRPEKGQSPRPREKE
ncbi:C50 carotenoid epsilon cyclase [Corynebacterium renale]|uniref:Lycopene cyclase domain-containing protein n=1 Tax=Corynebacterium renale TaxID=1724 RepID=A0A2A9DP19_9CORY|nr:lycopene cyclase domain-containing protein [Corynebacterium renale]SQG63355.1 C50 carotenoid epsilon cyclase [Corynebacterium renale]SQI21769.1 C50 carotenoid epsilon cyclase [Corynebacterium renale]STC99705.1 C50 carotenoid epsilon cyclase [Corynebacterium renale]